QDPLLTLRSSHDRSTARTSRAVLSDIAPPQDLPPSPTRRSSDLSAITPGTITAMRQPKLAATRPVIAPASVAPMHQAERVMLMRSEEHTSELQSRFDLVCRLLLVKKKI